MQLELTDEQGAVLHEVLDRVLGDLNMEISHTDNPRYRESLRERRGMLREVQGLISGAPTTT
jgi:hypothetical protein